MNITVVGLDGTVSCRPDTTWEREDKDFFVPDEVGGFSFTPVLYARLCRAGKCIGEKFAGRFYEGKGFGILLYAEGHPSPAIFDRSSVLPAAVYSKITLEKPDNEFIFKAGGDTVYSTQIPQGANALLEQALAKASRIVSQRIGDLLAVELETPAHLVSREDGSIELEASYCSNPLFNFKIVF